MVEPVVLVHGGAWEVPDKWVDATLEAVKLAASTGYKVLMAGGSGLDAIEAAINTMEDDPHMNSGRGGCLNLDGKAALDASIQRGSDLAAGCVALVEDVRHPITLAKKVLEETPHCFIGGEGASRLAAKLGVERVDPAWLVTEDSKQELEEFRKTNKSKMMDTVGCVVIDSEGHVFAGTSTGGTPGKYVGRIGDAPIIGCGTYADDGCGAVSTTGNGEAIMKYCLARRIIVEMEAGRTPLEAITACVDGLEKKLGQQVGAIAVTNSGEVGFYFTTPRMSWSYVKRGRLHSGIEKGQHESEPLE